jgi:hypothetical protein
MTAFREIDNLDPAVIAADHLLAAVGRKNAYLLMHALRADWMIPEEAEKFEAVVAGLAYLAGEDAPKHQGRPLLTRVAS